MWPRRNSNSLPYFLTIKKYKVLLKYEINEWIPIQIILYLSLWKKRRWWTHTKASHIYKLQEKSFYLILTNFIITVAVSLVLLVVLNILWIYIKLRYLLFCFSSFDLFVEKYTVNQYFKNWYRPTYLL